MKSTDYQLEQLYKEAGSRPQRKFEETETHFERDIFWYNRDEVSRQSTNQSTTKVTYENHRKVIETAVNMMNKNTQHDITMCILTHRFFSDYRATVFAGQGNFNLDYGFIIKKVGMIFNGDSSRINSSNISAALKEFTTPTLVQLNHITGTVKEVTVPSSSLTLNEWAIKFNETANSSSTYRVAGLSIG